MLARVRYLYNLVQRPRLVFTIPPRRLLGLHTMAATSITRSDIETLLKILGNMRQLIDNVTFTLEDIKAGSEQAASLLTHFLDAPVSFLRPANTPKPGSSRDDSGDYDLPPAKRPKLDFTNVDGYVVVYTDGACENNGSDNAKAGIGVWFGDNHPLNISKAVEGKATNNAAEIQACTCAIDTAKRNDVKKLKIITDSQFTLNAMTKWISGWKKNGWKKADGKEVKNKFDFQRLDDMCKGIDLKWTHCSGHSGVKGNEAADKLARAGAKMYKVAPK